MRGTAGDAEVCSAQRFFRVHHFTDHTPHVGSHAKHDMRHTIGQSTRHVTDTNRPFDDHARIPSP
jgi:hypothetical protein